MSSYIDELLEIMLGFLPLYGLVRILWICRQRKKCGQNRTEWHFQPVRELALGLFMLFMFGLLTLTFENQGVHWLNRNTLRYGKERWESGIGINLVPFRTIRLYVKYCRNEGFAWVNVLGNIVMFLPWGFGLPLLWKRNQSFLRVVVLALFLPMLIEFLQLFIGRSVDVDDIILNFAGAMLGGLLYAVISGIPGVKKLAR